eukprot:s4424_g2.t1
MHVEQKFTFHGNQMLVLSGRFFGSGRNDGNASTFSLRNVMARLMLSPVAKSLTLDPSPLARAAPVLRRPAAASGNTTNSRPGRFAVLAGVAATVSAHRQCRRSIAMAAQTIEANAYLKSKVEEMVALQPIMVFSKSWCPFCKKAKEAMEEQGIRFAVCELDTLGDEVEAQVQDILLGITGARTVPRVFVDGKCIGGGTDTVNLAADGTLSKLPGKAMENFKTKLQGAGTFDLQKSDEEWQSALDVERFRILRRRGTEMPGSHEYDKFLPKAGHFSCGGCGLPLYSAGSKFASTCGWPVFDKCTWDAGDHGDDPRSSSTSAGAPFQAPGWAR